MNLNAVVYQNYRKQIDEMLGQINPVLDAPDRERHLNKAGDRKFFSFNFTKFASQKFVMPYIRSVLIDKPGIKEVNWEISDKFNAIYLYVYVQ